ncbi:MAG: MFS transporter [Terrimonas sp.]|nr:MFS transporter [Terrimonas sp.]
MLRSGLSVYRNAYVGLSPAIWWLSLVMFINRSGTMVIPFLTLYLTRELGFSIAEAGIIMGFFGMGAMLGAYLGGWLIDKIGFYKVQIGSLLLNGCMFIVLGQMRGFWHIAICIFFLSTLGESFRPANASAIAHYSKPGNRTRSYSLNRLAVNLGFSIGPAAGGILASISYDWLFWTDGLTCIIAAVMLRIVMQPPVSPVTGQNGSSDPIPVKKSAYRDYTYLKFIFLVFLVAFCFLQLFSIVPLYYKEVVLLNESAIGILLASNGLLIAVTEMVLVFKLEGKRPDRIYIGTGALLIGLSFLLLTIHPVIGFVWAAMLMITLGEMLMFPFVNNFWVSRSTETNRGQYAALFTISFALANVMAPTIGTQVIKHFGYNALWYLLFSVCGLAAIGFNKLK